MDPSAPGGPNNGHALTKGKALSNAMRMGKRTLAGVAAGALGLSLVPFVGAGIASAATPSGTVTAVTGPAAARSAIAFDLAVTGTNLQTPNTTRVCTVLVSGPAGATLTSGTGTPSSATASTATATVSVAGTYSIGVFLVDTAEPATCTSTPGSAGTTAVLNQASVTVGGAVAAVSIAPASGKAPTGVNATYSVAATDSGGRPTLFTSGDTYTLSTDTSTVTTSPSKNVPGQTALSFTAQNSAAGSASITLTSNNGAVAPASTTLNAIAPATATSVAVTDPTPITGGFVPSGTNSVTFTITGSAADAGKEFYYTVSGTGAAAATGFVVVNSAGTATVAVSVTDSTNAKTVILSASSQSATAIMQDRAVNAATIVPAPNGANVRQLGASTPVAVSVKDQFGAPVSGYTVRAYRTSVASANFLSLGTTGADGGASVTVSPAAGLVDGNSELYLFTATSPAGVSTTATLDLTITYTTSGGITSLSVTPTPASTPTSVTDTTTTLTTMPYVTVPADGTANTVTTGTFAVASGAITAGNNGEVASFVVNSTPNNSVTVTAPAGVHLSATGTTAWNAGSSTLSVADLGTVYVFATKTGSHNITFTSGGKTVTIPILVGTLPANAYNIDISPADQRIDKGGFGTATVKVTDVFGNAVAGATGVGTGGVAVTASGDVLLAGYATTQNVSTGADGTATVTVIASNRVGAGTLTATPQAGSTTPAWVPGYVAPSGAPAPVTSDSAAVEVGEGDEKSITITGSRTTVSGKPGIMIDGVVVGIEDGKTVVPYFRFPGETSYTQGTARPEISVGEFTWQRKTGKKFYAYVTSDDGAVQSNRVIIAAS
jgi:hypothetical protein